MAYCENCGQELNGNKYCENCGHSNDIESIEKEDSVNSTQEAINEDVQQETLLENHQISEKRSKEKMAVSSMEKEDENLLNNQELHSRPVNKKMSGSTKLSIILGIALVLVLAGASYYWFSQQTSKETVVISTTTTETQLSSSSLVSSSSNKETTKEKEQFKTTVGDIDKQILQSLSGKAGVYVSDLSEPDVIYQRNANESLRSASIIKLFIMMIFYERVEEGSIRGEDVYTLKEADKVGGTGVLLDEPVGTELTYNELVERMIVDSDNTAGNILINLLDGPKQLTEAIQEKGYKETKIERRFVDTHALNNGLDNYTSASDVGNLLSDLYQQKLVSPVYDEQMLAILGRNKNHSKLPQEIDHLVTVYNKTGEYSDYGIQSDAAIFFANEKAYVVVVLTQDGKENEQVTALNQFGLELNNKLFKGGK